MPDSFIGEFSITHLDSFFSEFISIDEIIIENGRIGFRVGLFNPGEYRRFFEHGGLGLGLSFDKVSKTGFGFLEIRSPDHIMGISNLSIFSLVIPFFTQVSDFKYILSNFTSFAIFVFIFIHRLLFTQF
jgi:hypothetical protein